MSRLNLEKKSLHLEQQLSTIKTPQKQSTKILNIPATPNTSWNQISYPVNWVTGQEMELNNAD